MTYAIEKPDNEWKEILASKGAEPGAFEVTRHAATERPFSGGYERVWADAAATDCICCGAKLFDSSTWFDAGCGWPSSTGRCRAPSARSATPPTAWSAPGDRVRAMRRAPGPRLPRRADRHRPALLHELRLPRLPTARRQESLNEAAARFLPHRPVLRGVQAVGHLRGDRGRHRRHHRPDRLGPPFDRQGRGDAVAEPRDHRAVRRCDHPVARRHLHQMEAHRAVLADVREPCGRHAGVPQEPAEVGDGFAAGAPSKPPGAP